MLAAFLYASSSLAAQPVTPVKPVDDEKTFSFNIGNDVFSGTDGNYTSGLRLSVVSAENDVPEWAVNAAEAFPLFNEDGAKRWEIALGQDIYTPAFYKTNLPQPNDHPYAGWLYGTIGLLSDTGDSLDHLQLTLGVVGPASGAEQTQEFVHSILNVKHPLGWQYQLQNEPGVILSYEHKWRNMWQINPEGYGFDVTPSAGASLGNVLTQATVGTMLRFGKDLPTDYGPPLVGTSMAGTDYFKRSDGLGWYLFAGVEGDAVARNIFLDGNTFASSPSVDKKNFVGGLQAGLAVTYDGVRYAFTQSYRTKEYDTQTDPESFGALTVSWKF